MTRQAKRYLEMYRVLDGITDEEDSAAQCEAMQPVWDRLSLDDKQQVRRARQAQARQ